MEKLVSIIMPAYNAERFLEAAVGSVLEQTYTNWELLIADDCSQDRTKEIIENFTCHDQRIKGVFLPRNSGVAQARNAAIERARGTYIAFLDSDDLWKQTKLELHIRYMEEVNCPFTFSDYEIIDEYGKRISDVHVSQTVVDYKKLSYMNYFGCLTVVVLADYVKQLKMPLVKHEDYACWMNILKKYKCEARKIPGIHASYRKVTHSVSSNKLRTIGWVYRVFYSTQSMGICRSLFHTVIFECRTVLKYMNLGRAFK